MNFNLNDYVGFGGVLILLIAFLLNIANKLGKNSLGYLMMNFVGAGLACLASHLINYLPFIILEGTWTLVSLIALINYLFKKK